MPSDLESIRFVASLLTRHLPTIARHFEQNLLHLVRAADERGIGVMPVVGYTPQMLAENHPGAEEWAKFLVDTLGHEPGLAFWDVSNEPDYPATPTARVQSRVAMARYMAGVFRKLDGHTPITIGFAFEPTMEECADDVDVLVFHNYLRTRGGIRAVIDRAKKFAASVGKQVIDDEMGCLGRANPYDVTIQEHMQAGIGWYIWELMIVRDPTNGRGWGDIHGVFYPDGTIRDPSIPMAVMGIFRNRGEDIVLEEPDREGRVKREVAVARDWLSNPSADWERRPRYCRNRRQPAGVGAVGAHARTTDAPNRTNAPRTTRSAGPSYSARKILRHA